MNATVKAGLIKQLISMIAWGEIDASANAIIKAIASIHDLNHTIADVTDIVNAVAQEVSLEGAA